MLALELFTHDTSFPVGQMASGRKLPAALALPSNRDKAQRDAGAH